MRSAGNLTATFAAQRHPTADESCLHMNLLADTWILVRSGTFIFTPERYYHYRTTVSFSFD